MASRLRGSYPLAVLTALLGLSPYVAAATAFAAVAKAVGSDVGASPTAVQVAGGLGNAAYAVGLVLAAQLGLRYRQRRLFLAYVPVLVLGAALTAAAPDVVVLTIGRVLQGGGAGAMTISVLPMLLTQFPVGHLPYSAAVVSLGLFGASAGGPWAGGQLTTGSHWRWLFVAVAVIAAVTWLLALVTYPLFDPPDPERSFDGRGIGLVLVAATAVFLGASLLTGYPVLSWQVLPLLVVGVAALLVLVVVEDHTEDALIPVRSLSTQLPVTGLIAVMVGGATFVAGLELTQTYLTGAGYAPTTVGVRLWPAVLGAVVAAVIGGLLFKTRFLPVLVDVGLVCLVAAPALLLLLPAGHGPGTVVPVAAGLLGFGGGATTTPGLFLIGFGLPSTKLGRAFAMVQLLRTLATYAVAPVLAYVAMSAAVPSTGYRTGLIVCIVLAAGGLVAALAIPFASGARLRAPELEEWLDGDQALPSPDTAERLRTG